MTGQDHFRQIIEHSNDTAETRTCVLQCCCRVQRAGRRWLSFCGCGLAVLGPAWPLPWPCLAPSLAPLPPPTRLGGLLLVRGGEGARVGCEGGGGGECMYFCIFCLSSSVFSAARRSCPENPSRQQPVWFTISSSNAAWLPVLAHFTWPSSSLYPLSFSSSLSSSHSLTHTHPLSPTSHLSSRNPTLPYHMPKPAAPQKKKKKREMNAELAMCSALLPPVHSGCIVASRHWK